MIEAPPKVNISHTNHTTLMFIGLYGMYELSELDDGYGFGGPSDG